MLGFALTFGLLIVLIALAILAFEVWMLVDVIQNRQISDTARLLWIIGMLLIHPIVALVYYFTDRQRKA